MSRGNSLAGRRHGKTTTRHCSDKRTSHSKSINCSKGRTTYSYSPQILQRRPVCSVHNILFRSNPPRHRHSMVHIPPSTLLILRAGHLKSSKLEAVGVANTGYLPNKVNFSVRLARRNPAARTTNLISLL